MIRKQKRRGGFRGLLKKYPKGKCPQRIRRPRKSYPPRPEQVLRRVWAQWFCRGRIHAARVVKARKFRVAYMGLLKKSRKCRYDGDGISLCRRECRSDIYVRHICDPRPGGEKRQCRIYATPTTSYPSNRITKSGLFQQPLVRGRSTTPLRLILSSGGAAYRRSIATNAGAIAGQKGERSPRQARASPSIQTLLSQSRLTFGGYSG